MRSLARIALSFALAVAFARSLLAAQPARALDIYWIDVEGGAATLIVTPRGQSVLMDAGWAGFDDRDARRIVQVLREAGLTRLDYLLISHFHADHAGGLAALARLVPIGSFVDHGPTVDTSAASRGLWEAYLAAAGSHRHSASPGERLPLEGVELTVVAAHSRFLPQSAGSAEPNPLCAAYRPQAEDRGENGKSLGYLLRAGKFEFVNLGDLSWNFQHELACPVNLLGKVDLYQVTHHGVRDDVLPAQVWALAPTVAVMNNGPAKGAGTTAVETVLRSPGLTDLWALHRALGNDAAHNAPEALTANLGETSGCSGAWIRARVNPNGTYTLTNGRTGFSKTYRAK